jgi:formamidopyrimidine-DNA glycosylase
MPELPEVERFRILIEKTSLTKRIDSVEISAPKMIEGCSETEFQKTLTGNSFTTTHRHGKFLFAGMKEGGYVMLHFALTGELHFVESGDKEPPRFVMHIHFDDDSSLYLSDTRKLGKISLVENVNTFISERGYGKDALSITESEFVQRIKNKRMAIKTALMDQKVVAGVGNEFSDEILFQSRIHPETAAASLTKKQLEKIYSKMVIILNDSVRDQSDRDALKHFFFLENRKAGLPCPRCKSKTISLSIGGRSSFLCPNCQK